MGNLITDRTKSRWFYPKPVYLFVVLLAVEAVLILSGRLFSQGWAVLTAIACVGALFILMCVWCLLALLFRWRFQFSLRSLLILTVVVAVPFSWLAVEINGARKQKEVVDALSQFTGSVSYDYEYDSIGNWIPTTEPPGPSWLRKVLGDDFFVNVVIVYFAGPKAEDAALKYLEGMKQVREIQFIKTRITDAGLEHIKGLNQLKELYFNHDQITDAGLEHLKGLNRLEILFLRVNKITDTGLEHLKGLNRLEILDLRETQVSDDGIQKLQKAIPNVEIIH
jgi:hypothetical protein